MLTKLIFKASLVAMFITFVYCTVTNVSLVTSITRALSVFAGFYFILIAFFIALRLIFNPAQDEEAATPEDNNETQKILEAAQREVGNTETESIGVAREQ